MAHQVMNDVQTELRDADEAQDRTAFLAGEQEWQRDARAFLLNQGGDAQAPPPKKIALRKSARAWCVAVDKQLRNALGDGLARFRLATSIRDRGAAESWPVLSMSIDQGSDGWTAAMYLCWHNTNMVIMFDPSHRAWNDAKSGLQSSKLWGAAVLLQVTMNLDHGPWRDGRWHAEIVEAAGVYSKFGSPEDCAILQSLLEPIVRDTGDFDMLADPLLARNISATLPDYFQDLQPKVSMTRWFGLVDASNAYLPRWHRRLLVQLFLCLQTGVFKVGRPSEATRGNGLVKVSCLRQRNRRPMGRPRSRSLNRVWNLQFRGRLLRSACCGLGAGDSHQSPSWRHVVVRHGVAFAVLCPSLAAPRCAWVFSEPVPGLGESIAPRALMWARSDHDSRRACQRRQACFLVWDLARQAAPAPQHARHPAPPPGDGEALPANGGG